MSGKLNGKLDDDDLCGLAPFTTLKIDPYRKGACKNHDEAFERMIAGDPDASLVNTTLRFARDTTSVALKGLYAVATFPLYLTIGTLGGIIRWGLLSRRK